MRKNKSVPPAEAELRKQDRRAAKSPCLIGNKASSSSSRGQPNTGPFKFGYLIRKRASFHGRRNRFRYVGRTPFRLCPVMFYMPAVDLRWAARNFPKAWSALVIRG